MQRLNGRVEILRYLGIRSRTTLRKWRALGLPIHRTPTGRVFAVCEELNAWRRPSRLRNGVTREHRGGRNADSPTAFMRRLLDTPAREKGRIAESKR
jgi:hypothetical protein